MQTDDSFEETDGNGYSQSAGATSMGTDDSNIQETDERIDSVMESDDSLSQIVDSILQTDDSSSEASYREPRTDDSFN